MVLLPLDLIINLSSFNLLPSTTPVLLDFTYVPLEVLSWPESLFAVFSVTSYKKNFLANLRPSTWLGTTPNIFGSKQDKICFLSKL